MSEKSSKHDLAIIRDAIRAIQEDGCAQWCDRLVDSLDGNDAEAARHAAECDRCKRELQLLWTLRMTAKARLGHKIDGRALVQRLREVQIGQHPGIGARKHRWPVAIAASLLFSVLMMRSDERGENSIRAGISKASEYATSSVSAKGDGGTRAKLAEAVVVAKDTVAGVDESLYADVIGDPVVTRDDAMSSIDELVDMQNTAAIVDESGL